MCVVCDRTFADSCNGCCEQILNENPYLSSKVIWKLVTYKEDKKVKNEDGEEEEEEQEPEVTASEIEWKETDEAKEIKEASPTFLEVCGS